MMVTVSIKVKQLTGIPDKATDNGTIGKLTVSYAPTDDMMLYATISEGYRAGFLNRPGGYTSRVALYSTL